MGEHTLLSHSFFIQGTIMSRIAVDIVLLPEQAMTDLAIAANGELVKNSGSEIMLNKKDCLPHISLAMGCIDRRDVARVGEMLRPIAVIAPKRLKVVDIIKSTNFSGETVSVFQVKRSEQLQKLHEEICDIVRPFFNWDVTDDMISGGHALRPGSGQASASTLGWIENYFVKSAYSNYSPHITIGYGDLPDRPLPCDFAVSHMAICHLGNHCTCTKVLWSVEI